jgi:hypothetical protein
MFPLRTGRPDDYDFFYRVDREDEGISLDFKASWTPDQWVGYRALVRSFLTDAGKVVFVAEDSAAGADRPDRRPLPQP